MSWPSLAAAGRYRSFTPNPANVDLVALANIARSPGAAAGPASARVKLRRLYPSIQV
jgi:hypothetical protein